MTALMSASLMQTIDSTIVNVALPQMQGQLGCTPDEISWALTSYMVATAVFMPLTGFIVDRFGQRRCLIWGVAGFVAGKAPMRSLDP